jgi:hypothetical protein
LMEGFVRHKSVAKVGFIMDSMVLKILIINQILVVISNPEFRKRDSKRFDADKILQTDKHGLQIQHFVSLSKYDNVTIITGSSKTF